MDDASIWMQQASQAVSRTLGQFLEFLPTLLWAAVLLTLGWQIARTARSGGTRLAYWFNGLAENRLSPERARHFRISNTGVALLGNLTFWIIVLVFVTSATRVLGLQTFSAWLDRVVIYLPTLIAGGLIVLVGILISTLVRDLTTATVASTGVAQADVLGRIMQAIVLVTAAILGLNQIGVDVSLLVVLIAIIAGAAVGGLALAFALGARTFVSNLIGAHHLQQHCIPGQRVRMADVEGEILEVTPVGVVIATQDGKSIVPAKAFNEAVTTVLLEAGDNE